MIAISHQRNKSASLKWSYPAILIGKYYRGELCFIETHIILLSFIIYHQDTKHNLALHFGNKWLRKLSINKYIAYWGMLRRHNKFTSCVLFPWTSILKVIRHFIICFESNLFFILPLNSFKSEYQWGDLIVKSYTLTFKLFRDPVQSTTTSGKFILISRINIYMSQLF